MTVGNTGTVAVVALSSIAESAPPAIRLPAVDAEVLRAQKLRPVAQRSPAQPKRPRAIDARSERFRRRRR